jgi:hypothetical protein
VQLVGDYITQWSAANSATTSVMAISSVRRLNRQRSQETLFVQGTAARVPDMMAANQIGIE